jgi:hypothetical protein
MTPAYQLAQTSASARSGGGSVPDILPRDTGGAGGGHRLEEAVVSLGDPPPTVVDRQPGQHDMQMPLTLTPALLLDRPGGTSVFGSGPLRAQRWNCVPLPAALAAGAPTGDPGIDLVRGCAGVRVGFQDVGDPALVVEGRPVSRVVYPAHGRTPLRGRCA